MDNTFPNWLTEQMIKGIKGFNLDAYLVALEGWRRGLTLRWYYDAAEITDMKLIGFNPLGKVFSLTSREKTHFFYRSRGDSVSNQAVDITSNKKETKAYLAKAKVPTPDSIGFNDQASNKEILKQGLEMGFPLVIKPIYGSLGKGVVTYICDENELKESIDYVRSELGYLDVLIEHCVSGNDIRLYVAGDRILGATKRIPANVRGDGNHTIKELIEYKNEERKDNRYLRPKLIELNQSLYNQLSKNGWSLDDIPQKGQFIRLKDQSNIAAGADPVDVTNEVAGNVKDMAIHAVKAIPGLYHAGVDVIVNNENEVQVIEINATADIGMHLFPITGTSRNIPEGIIDYYFPKTKDLAKDRIDIYFDYREISKVIQNKHTQEILVSEAPNGQMYKARYIVSGDVQKVNYRSWIKKQALRKELSGYTRNLNNGNVVVVVGGHDKIITDEFKKICKKGPPKSKVKEVKKLEWTKPIKLGFEIK